MAISRIRFRVDTTPDTNSTSDLTGAINTSVTTVPVTNGSHFEIGQNIRVTNNASQVEEMTITDISSNNLTVVRAANGTTARSHESGKDVFKDDSPTYTPTINPQIGTEVSKQYDGVVARKSLGGKTFATANHNTSRIVRKLIYENLSESDKDRLVALIDYTKGQLNSFQYSEDGNTWYTVRFTNNKLPVSETAYNAYSAEIQIEEQL